MNKGISLLPTTMSKSQRSCHIGPPFPAFSLLLFRDQICRWVTESRVVWMAEETRGQVPVHLWHIVVRPCWQTWGIFLHQNSILSSACWAPGTALSLGPHGLVLSRACGGLGQSAPCLFSSEGHCPLPEVGGGAWVTKQSRMGCGSKASALKHRWQECQTLAGPVKFSASLKPLGRCPWTHVWGLREK